MWGKKKKTNQQPINSSYLNSPPLQQDFKVSFYVNSCLEMKARILKFEISSRFWETQLQCLLWVREFNLYFATKDPSHHILPSLKLFFLLFFLEVLFWLVKSSCSADHIQLLKTASKMVVLVKNGRVNVAFPFVKWLSLTSWLTRLHNLSPEVNQPR